MSGTYPLKLHVFFTRCVRIEGFHTPQETSWVRHLDTPKPQKKNCMSSKGFINLPSLVANLFSIYLPVVCLSINESLPPNFPLTISHHITSISSTKFCVGYGLSYSFLSPCQFHLFHQFLHGL